MNAARKSNVEPEHLVGASLVLTLFSWFITVALLNGSIRMGIRGRASVIISRQEDPSDYWFSVGWLLFFTILGWVAVGLNGYRLLREKKTKSFGK